jgi:thiamine biosynthesis protein ThiI
MSESNEAVWVLRYGEIFLKLGNRGYFERCLENQIHRVLAPLPARVERRHGRFLVRAEPRHAAEVSRRLGYVLGLTSSSQVTLVERDLAAITAAAVAVAEHAVRDAKTPLRTFRIETRRPDKSFPLPSPEIDRRVGDVVNERIGLGVNLTAADLRVEVEIGQRDTFVTADRQPGPGGLPVGCSGPVALLLSGGIDSPVAGWLLLKRGCTLLPITFESPPYTGPEAREKVIELTSLLAAWGGPLRLRLVRFTEIQKEIRSRCPARLAVVLYRRMMIRVAEVIARSANARALATGESLGQVASQTLENLAAIEAVATLPVLRPLVTHDKQETVTLARRLGTYPISVRPHVDCCSLFVPEHPETRARLEVVVEAEAAIPDLAARAQALADEAEVVEVQDPMKLAPKL